MLREGPHYFLINKFQTAVQKILVTEKIKDNND